MRLDELDRQKREEEERVRIVIEKEKYRGTMESKVKEENAAVEQLIEERRWSSLTEEYHKSYDTARPKLSTFINVLK